MQITKMLGDLGSKSIEINVVRVMRRGDLPIFEVDLLNLLGISSIAR